MLPPGRVAVVTALPEELAPILERTSGLRRVPLGKLFGYEGTLGGRRVLLAVSGDGQVRAERGMRAVLSRSGIGAWIGAGFAGSLASGIAVGTILVARSVTGDDGLRVPVGGAWMERACGIPGANAAHLRSVGRIAATREQKGSLGGGPFAEAGDVPSGVDIESLGWLRGADAMAPSTPRALVRVVSDAFEEEIPDFVAAAAGGDGSLDRRRIVLHAATHPLVIGKLLAMRRRARFCAGVLADFVERLIASENLPLIASENERELR